MRLVAYDVNKVERPAMYKRTKLLAVLEEFMKSDDVCVEIKDFNHRDAYVCASCFRRAIVRYNFGGVAAIARRNQAFLIKTK